VKDEFADVDSKQQVKGPVGVEYIEALLSGSEEVMNSNIVFNETICFNSCKGELNFDVSNFIIRLLYFVR
jgi:hypothetical protein